MSSAGVSRSGRVRKKSAKLIEMEKESVVGINNNLINTNPNNSNNNNINSNNNKQLIKSTAIHSNSINNSINDSINDNNDNNTSVITPDHDFGKPLKKKLKIKLSFSGNVSKPLTINEKSIKTLDNMNDSNNSVKKGMIPPLKIPKSKITGMLSPNHINSDTFQTQSTHQLELKEEKETVSQLTSTEPKSKSITNKKVKININNKELNTSKPDIEVEKEVIESTPEVNILNENVEESVIKVVCEQSLPTINSNTNSNAITETPKLSKVLKPKKKEHESAANRLFRQITSGVAIPVKTKTKTKGNRKKKSFPLEDLSAVSYDEDLEETSLVIATEDLIKIKPKNKRIRQTKALKDNKKEDKKSKKSKNLAEGMRPKKKRSVISGYMIWSKEHRSKIQQNCPDMDFADVSRKLGEIWQSMPKNEKTQWKRKAQKLIGNGSSIISTGKPKPKTSISQVSKVKTSFGASSSALSPELLSNDDYSKYTSVDESRPIGTSPIDVSAHLRLLGDNLSMIGLRLKEHSGQIAVSGSLSVLLDSTLCAICPLLCLTKLDPRLDGCSHETHKKTLDNIAYIMPGI